MEKILKVCNAPQGGGYVPSVRIAGNYLNDVNFSVDDFVIINLRKNCITIKKATKQSLIKRMAAKNPNLLKMIDMFDLKL